MQTARWLEADVSVKLCYSWATWNWGEVASLMRWPGTVNYSITQLPCHFHIIWIAKSPVAITLLILEYIQKTPSRAKGKCYDLNVKCPCRWFQTVKMMASIKLHKAYSHIPHPSQAFCFHNVQHKFPPIQAQCSRKACQGNLRKLLGLCFPPSS